MSLNNCEDCGEPTSTEALCCQKCGRASRCVLNLVRLSLGWLVVTTLWAIYAVAFG